MSAARELLQAMNERCLAAWEALDCGDDDALLVALDDRERLQAGAGDILASVRAGDRHDETYALAVGVHLWNGRLEQRIRARRDEASAELRQLQRGSHTLAGYAAGSTSPRGQFQAVG